LNIFLKTVLRQVLKRTNCFPNFFFEKVHIVHLQIKNDSNMSREGVDNKEAAYRSFFAKIKNAARRPIPKVFAQTKVLRIARVQNKGADVRY
jgi:hypothetical protein